MLSNKMKIVTESTVRQWFPALHDKDLPSVTPDIFLARDDHTLAPNRDTLSSQKISFVYPDFTANGHSHTKMSQGQLYHRCKTADLKFFLKKQSRTRFALTTDS